MSFSFYQFPILKYKVLSVFCPYYFQNVQTFDIQLRKNRFPKVEEILLASGLWFEPLQRQGKPIFIEAV